jgi:methylsterol monooxygenase
VTTIAFWIPGLAFLYMDYFQTPKFLMKYKVQPGKNQPPDNKKVLKVTLPLQYKHG